MKNTRKVLSMLLVITMVFAMSVNALAVDAGNLTMFDTDYTYTFSTEKLASKAGNVDIMVTLVDDSWMEYTWFSSEDEALDVDWSVKAGSTLSGLTITEQEPIAMDENMYLAWASVNVPAGSTSGSASIEASYHGQTVNVTVVVNTTLNGDAQYDAAPTGVSVKIYDPATNKAEPKVFEVSPANFTSAQNGARSFATVMDTMLLAKSSGLVDEYEYTDYAGYAVNVTSMKVKDVVYENKSVEVSEGVYEYLGWQYRVYRNNTLLPISEVLGVDDFQLQSGDVIVWKYGVYGQVSFGNTL